MEMKFKIIEVKNQWVFLGLTAGKGIMVNCKLTKQENMYVGNIFLYIYIFLTKNLQFTLYSGTH